MINDYADKIYRLQTRLESYSVGIGAELSRIIKGRLKDTIAEVASGDMTTKKGLAEIDRALSDIVKASDAAQTLAIQEAMSTGIMAGYGAEKAGLSLVNQAVKAKVLNDKLIMSKAWGHILQEQSISVGGLWDKYIGTSSQRLKAIPRLAYQQGWSITRTVNKLKDLAKIDQRSAVAVARTTILSASNVARAEYLKQTDVEKEIYKATLDSRTTPACRDYDGRVFDIGKGPQPPIHISCRSVRLAVPSDMTPAEFKKGLQTSSRGLDGKTKIIPYQDYGTWLKTQPVKFQESVIGVARTKMLNDGTISFTKMYVGGKYLTVKDLERLYK
jgi:SPP1 gp7 family putative phage head morphogenesis protein